MPFRQLDKGRRGWYLWTYRHRIGALRGQLRPYIGIYGEVRPYDGAPFTGFDTYLLINTLVATPNEGWGFYRWKENGKELLTEADAERFAEMIQDEVREMTSAGQFVGKTHYAAPELLLGDLKHQDRTTDIYSLGVAYGSSVTIMIKMSGFLEVRIHVSTMVRLFSSHNMAKWGQTGILPFLGKE